MLAATSMLMPTAPYGEFERGNHFNVVIVSKGDNVPQLNDVSTTTITFTALQRVEGYAIVVRGRFFTLSSGPTWSTSHAPGSTRPGFMGMKVWARPWLCIVSSTTTASPTLTILAVRYFSKGVVVHGDPRVGVTEERLKLGLCITWMVEGHDRDCVTLVHEGDHHSSRLLVEVVSIGDKDGSSIRAHQHRRCRIDGVGAGVSVGPVRRKRWVPDITHRT